MRVAPGTNRLTDLFRGDPGLAALLETCDEVWLPLTVLGEIKAGFYGSARRPQNERLLQAFLAKDNAGVLSPCHETAEHYTRLFVQLRRAGTPVPDNDLWIAAIVLEHDLHLISRDRHFHHIPQLLTSNLPPGTGL